ncbi:MAG: 30S ribosomal protein S2 [Candidatus Gracilibacteria bacterium]|nr:30S ribosomal protein S2 [Candidatus Gracilibacteria bacterium]
MEKKVLNEMFENLLHIGNKANHWNPKMREYIYGSSNGVHVINLIKTVSKLAIVKAELAELAKQGKKVLFVSTKLQAREAFAKLAVDTGNFYVNEKWVPGLLTNLKTMRARISTYISLIKESNSGALDVLPKKEKATKLLELEKLDRAFKGLKEMKKLPDVIFVVDAAYEIQAVKEANSLKLPVYAMASTNSNPDLLTNLIPANTNSVKSIEYIAQELKSVVKSSAAPSNKGNFKKFEDKKAPAKKTVAKKEEVKKVEVKTETKKEEK